MNKNDSNELESFINIDEESKKGLLLFKEFSKCVFNVIFDTNHKNDLPKLICSDFDSSIAEIELNEDEKLEIKNCFKFHNGKINFIFRYHPRTVYGKKLYNEY